MLPDGREGERQATCASCRFSRLWLVQLAVPVGAPVWRVLWRIPAGGGWGQEREKKGVVFRNCGLLPSARPKEVLVNGQCWTLRRDSKRFVSSISRTIFRGWSSS